MKLAVSSWFPHQHQATALCQLIGYADIVRIPLASVSNTLHDAALGPFLALLEDEGPPIVGMQAIVEALHRRFPERGLLPVDPIERAKVRALSDMIEERFSRHCFAAIADHADYDRKRWPAESDAANAIIATPPLLSSIEVQQVDSDCRFLVGERPTLADCLLAATWWTMEDQGLQSLLAEHVWLSQWHRKNCQGTPFHRAETA